MEKIKYEGQGHGYKVSIFKNVKKLKKINNIVIENYVYPIDSETKMGQHFKSKGQCQGHKISIFEIVE